MNKRYKGHQNDLLVKIAIIALLMGILMPALARIKRSPNTGLILVIIGIVIFLIVVIAVISALLHKRRIAKITREQFESYLKACEEISAEILSEYGTPPIKKVIEVSGLNAKTELLIRRNEYFLVQKFPDVIKERISGITREQYDNYRSAEGKLYKEGFEKGDYHSLNKKQIAEDAGIDLMTVSKIIMYSKWPYKSLFSEKFPKWMK